MEAFSSEVGTGSREENASKQESSEFGPKTRDLAVTKSSKAVPFPFPKRACVDTYAPHPLALPGLPSQEARWNGSIGSQALAGFVSDPVFRRRARFNAGWSSPVARQAHNLKVIGSNPIPATK
jgi:hypothetical protein